MNRFIYAIAGLLLLSTSASAHVGVSATHDFTHGVLHPLTGLDHLLAAFAVGLWGAMAGGRRAIVWPLTFVGVMALATSIGAEGFAIPVSDVLIAATVIALGLLVATAVQASTIVGALAIGAFAFIHGHAHGAEGGAAWPYLAGLIAATTILHGIGLATAKAALAVQRPALIRATGAAVAVAGVVLLVSAS
jgi:urease accessory protein